MGKWFRMKEIEGVKIFLKVCDRIWRGGLGWGRAREFAKAMCRARGFGIACVRVRVKVPSDGWLLEAGVQVGWSVTDG